MENVLWGLSQHELGESGIHGGRWGVAVYVVGIILPAMPCMSKGAGGSSSVLGWEKNSLAMRRDVNSSVTPPAIRRPDAARVNVFAPRSVNENFRFCNHHMPCRKAQTATKHHKESRRTPHCDNLPSSFRVICAVANGPGCLCTCGTDPGNRREFPSWDRTSIPAADLLRTNARGGPSGYETRARKSRQRIFRV